MTVSTGNKILDAQMNALSKAMGRNDAFSLGPGFERATPIPTGSLALDLRIGLGGIPQGRIIELYGYESSGKTSLSLRMLKSWLDMREELGQGHRKALYIDLEHTTGDDMLAGMGIDSSQVLWFKAETTEQALNTMMKLVKTEQIGFVVLDSVDALQSEAELAKDIGDESMGGTGKHMSKHLREMSKIAFNTNTTCVYVNQIRAAMVMMGSPITTPGGNALKFYASLRMQTLPRKDSKLPGAFVMRVKIIKNKVAPPTKDEVEFDFYYAKGPDPYLDTLYAAKDVGVIRMAGPTCKVKWYDADDEETLSSGGYEGARGLLMSDPALFQRLRKSALIAGGVSDGTTAAYSTSGYAEAYDGESSGDSSGESA